MKKSHLIKFLLLAALCSAVYMKVDASTEATSTVPEVTASAEETATTEAEESTIEEKLNWQKLSFEVHGVYHEFKDTKVYYDGVLLEADVDYIDESEPYRLRIRFIGTYESLPPLEEYLTPSFARGDDEVEEVKEDEYLKDNAPKTDDTTWLAFACSFLFAGVAATVIMKRVRRDLF